MAQREDDLHGSGFSIPTDVSFLAEPWVLDAS